MENSIYFSKDYPLNILIAEPDHDSRLSAKDALIGLGYQPEIATTGRKLLQMTSSKMFDVVFMDAGRPEAESILGSPLAGNELAGNDSRRPILIEITKPVDLAELSLQLKACALLTGSRHIRPAS
jgi:DNA-binding NtrC family response regulator